MMLPSSTSSTAVPGPRPRRSGLFRLIASAGCLVMMGAAVSAGSFTDAVTVGVGSKGSIGGGYDIALVDGKGSVQQGNPTPLVIDTTGVATMLIGPVANSATISTKVVTTTTITGSVVLRLYNGYSGTRPSDPGMSGPGADPYDVALFTITVDGAVVSTFVTAAALNTSGVTITGWTTGIAKTIQVSMTMPRNLTSPYYFNRALVLGLQFDGSST